MKIRTGFVSNSSSSSFVLSRDPKEKDTTISLTVSIKLSEIQEHCIKTEKALREWIDDYYGDGDDYGEELFKKCLKEIENGQHILVGSVANDSDNPVEVMLYETGFRRVLKENKGIKVIEDGY